jgi:hypothetical protein
MQVRKAYHVIGITSSEMLASCVGAGRHLSSMYESGLKPAAMDPGGEMGAPAKTRAACSWPHNADESHRIGLFAY